MIVSAQSSTLRLMPSPGNILGAGRVPFTGALDSSSPTAAWSFNNRLVSAYSGSKLLRGRESAGSTESDFNYKVNGAVDVSAEAAFAGAGNLFSSKLYGQVAGTVDFAQSSASAQPQISTSDGLVSFDGAAQYLKGASKGTEFSAGSGSYTVMMRAYVSSWTAVKCLGASGDVGPSGAGDWFFFVRNATGNILYFECRDSGGTYRQAGAVAPTAGQWFTVWGYLDTANQKFGTALNGSAGSEVAAAWTLGTGTAVLPQIGAGWNSSYGTYPFPGKISHMAIWKRMVSTAERSAIHTALGSLP